MKKIIAVFMIICASVFFCCAENCFSLEDEKQDERKDKMDVLMEKVRELDEEVQRLRDAAEIRQKLELTDDEKKEGEEKVLESAGREYVLAKEGQLDIELNSAYYYTSSDRLEIPLNIEHRNNHTFRNTVRTEYAIKNNFTVNFNLPFVYKYDRVGGDDGTEESDIGDIYSGAQWQPHIEAAGWPATIFFLTYSADTGTSPFEIVPGEELSTGDGFDSVTFGASFSKGIDPLVVFGSLSYSYNCVASGLHQNYGGDILEKVETGDDISLGIGFGYALSYKVSINLQYQHTYKLKSKYHWQNSGTNSSSTSTASSFNIGTGWRISPKQSIYITLGIGLTDDVDDLSLTVRIPFSFML